MKTKMLTCTHYSMIPRSGRQPGVLVLSRHLTWCIGAYAKLLSKACAPQKQCMSSGAPQKQCMVPSPVTSCAPEQLHAEEEHGVLSAGMAGCIYSLSLFTGAIHWLKAIQRAYLHQEREGRKGWKVVYFAWNVGGQVKYFNADIFCMQQGNQADILCISETGAGHAPAISGFTCIRHSMLHKGPLGGCLGVMGGR